MNKKEVLEALLNGERVLKTVDGTDTLTFIFLDEDTGDLRYSIGNNFTTSYELDSFYFSSNTKYEIAPKNKYYRWKIKRHGKKILSSFWADEDGQTIDGTKIEMWNSLEKEITTMCQEY